MLRRQLLAAFGMVIVFTVLTGLVYPLVVTAIGQIAFHDKAEGSLVEVDGKVVGSSLIGQSFTAERYFHPRPSAAGDGYDASESSGSNLGPSNPAFLSTVEQRVADYRAENSHAADAAVPVDAVTASGSGLDPHISIANARLQAPRVAAARGLDAEVVLELIEKHTDGRDLGFLGEPGVNVLELNIALDAIDAG
jgi:potassium-transporting ATPase KdpC subunit